MVGRSKDVAFKHIAERDWGNVQGWKGQRLSKEGKEILVKSVIQAVLAYTMSCVSFTKFLKQLLYLCYGKILVGLMQWTAQGALGQLGEVLCAKEMGRCRLQGYGGFQPNIFGSARLVDPRLSWVTLCKF